MPRYLLETSVYLQPLRRRPVMKALERWQEVGDNDCAVSLVSVGEIEWGLHYENNPRRWENMQLFCKTACSATKRVRAHGLCLPE